MIKIKPILASLLMATAVTMLPALPQQEGDLRLEESKIHGDPGERMISGRVMNTSTVTYSGVEIRFRCLDASGVQVGAVTDSTHDLGPQGTWSFDIEVSDKVANYELTSLAGEKAEPSRALKNTIAGGLSFIR